MTTKGQSPNDKQKKKQQAILIVGVGSVVVLALSSIFLIGGEETKQPETSRGVQITPPGQINDQDAWRAMQAADQKTSEERIADLEARLASEETNKKAIEQKLAEMDDTIKNQKVTQSSVEQPQQVTNAGEINQPGSYPKNPNGKQGLYGNQILSDPLGSTVDPATGIVTPIQIPQKKIEIIDFSKADDQTGSNGTGAAGTTLPGGSQPAMTTTQDDGIYIPEGSFLRAIMLNGADAPTGGMSQENPLAIAFEAVDFIDMPNKYKTKIKNCRFIAQVWGDLSSERVMGRLEAGNCIVNGQTVRLEIKGHIIGEDGKPGVRGRVVTKQGQVLANAALASAVEAIGGLYSNTVGTTTVGALGVTRTVDSKDLKNAAIGGGVGGAAEKLSDYYMKRANDLFPIIEADAGRVVEILVTKGAVVKGLNPSNNTASSTRKRKLKDD